MVTFCERKNKGLNNFMLLSKRIRQQPMKTLYKISLAMLVLFSIRPYQTSAQDDIGDLIKGSQEDAEYLAAGYLESFLKATGSGINQGWYNTAKPHKIGGFDFTVSVALIAVPDDEKYYTVDNSKLQTIELVRTSSTDPNSTITGGSGKVPSLVGPAVSPVYRYKAGQPDAGLEFNGPEGLDIDVLNRSTALPVFNLSIGLPKGTELKVRWSPSIDLGDAGQAKIFGLGVMHDIKQYIPGIKMLPFDLSAMFAYSKMNLDFDLDEPGQRAEFEIQGTTLQAIVSKKISIITPYASVGFATSKASVITKGDYNIGSDVNGDPIYVTDPISGEGKMTTPRFSAGLRLQLLVLTFHADYTLQKYSTITGGVGLTIR